MNRAERRLHRAIRITPPGDRDRYADEWRGDLAAAAVLGLSPADVARGASRVAWHLRARYSVRTLAGAEGFGKATVAWAALALSVPVAWLFIGGPSILGIPAVMVTAVIVAARSARPTNALVMAVTGPLGLACIVFFAWHSGTGTSPVIGALSIGVGPFWMRIGPLLLSNAVGWLGVVSFIAFWIVFAVSVARNSPKSDRRTQTAHSKPADD